MSAETYAWLRENIKIGFTDERGPAWHANRQLDDNGKPIYLSDGSHYPGAVPEEDVRRLLDVKLVSAKVFGQWEDWTVCATCGHAMEGNSVFNAVHADGLQRDHDPKPMRHVTDDPTRQLIVDADSGLVLGVFKQGYQIHLYNEWINEGLQAIAGTNLETAAVALLRNKAVAFHQVKLPDTYEVGGYGFQPFFTGATSCDGTVASTWFTGAIGAVCDNTYEMARAGAVTRVSRKHTSKSLSDESRVDIASRLALVNKAGEDFTAWAEELQSVDVTDAEFTKWLDETQPIPEKIINPKSGNPQRGWTQAVERRAHLIEMYYTDAKVKPWNGTAFGVVQLDNTWRTWDRTVKGVQGGRFERNLLNQVDGTSADEDDKALAALWKVMGRELVAA